MAEFAIAASSIATQTSVASSATSVTLLGSVNRKRKRLFIANTSTAILYLKLCGETISAATATTAHSIQMAANTNIELVAYTGTISGIWASANGQANITELE